jgi:hypothetical protein
MNNSQRNQAGIREALEFIGDQNSKYAKQYNDQMGRIVSWSWKAFTIQLLIAAGVLAWFQLKTLPDAQAQLKQEVQDNLKSLITTERLEKSLDKYVQEIAPPEFQTALDKAVAQALEARKNELLETANKAIFADARRLQVQREELDNLANELLLLQRRMIEKRCGVGDTAANPPCYREIFADQWRPLNERIIKSEQWLRARIGKTIEPRLKEIEDKRSLIDNAFAGKTVSVALGAPIGPVVLLMDLLRRSVDLVK